MRRLRRFIVIDYKGSGVKKYKKSWVGKSIIFIVDLSISFKEVIYSRI